MNKFNILGKTNSLIQDTPIISYLTSTGTAAKYEFYNEGNGNWKIKFLETGILKFLKYRPDFLEIFLVGAGGGSDGSSEKYPGGGGGGYTCKTVLSLKDKKENEEFAITVGTGVAGAKGGNTSAFGITVKGGSVGTNAGKGGAGGSGGGNVSNENITTPSTTGKGGENGQQGYPQTTDGGGLGQSFTTKEFYDNDGELYSGGGGGLNKGGSGSLGGAGGGGTGGTKTTNNADAVKAATPLPNTGGGAGGVYNKDIAGGSGIVIIRNIRNKE